MPAPVPQHFQYFSQDSLMLKHVKHFKSFSIKLICIERLGHRKRNAVIAACACSILNYMETRKFSQNKIFFYLNSPMKRYYII